jgi:hypothetical protein
MAGLPYDGPGWISSNMDREQELQHPAQAGQHIAEGAEHIKWQREVVAILERISTSAEAIEGARALLTTFLETQAQREQDRDRIRASLDCNLDSSSTVVGGVAGPHLGADRTPVQLEAKLADLGEGRPSETASFDAVSQDEAADYRLRSQSITGTRLLGLLPEIQRTVQQGKLPVSQVAKAAVLDIETQHQIADRAEAGYVWRIVQAAAAWITGLARRVGRYRSRRDPPPS